MQSDLSLSLSLSLSRMSGDHLMSFKIYFSQTFCYLYIMDGDLLHPVERPDVLLRLLW